MRPKAARDSQALGNTISHLIKEGDFQEWAQGTGKVKLVDQAQRQIKAARGVPIEWHVAQEDVAQVMRQLFKNEKVIKNKIKIIHTPMK